MRVNRNRQPGPILRTTVSPAPPAPVSRNLGSRVATVAAAPGPIRRTRALPMTGAQRDSTGRMSDWNRSASLRPWTTEMTAAWSPTVTTMPRGGIVDPTAYPTTR